MATFRLVMGLGAKVEVNLHHLELTAAFLNQSSTRRLPKDTMNGYVTLLKANADLITRS